jgi:hypothetical protein
MARPRHDGFCSVLLLIIALLVNSIFHGAIATSSDTHPGSIASVGDDVNESPELQSIVPHTTIPTSGGTTLTISGIHFGNIGTTPITLTYGPTGTELIASNCAIIVDDTNITCTSPNGAGGTWLLRLTIGTRSATNPNAITISYAPPMITQIEDISPPTVGGTPITLIGSNFGPAGLSWLIISAVYGTEPFTATNCTIIASNTKLQCMTAQGWGASLQWSVTVGGLTSVPSSGSMSYAAPIIDLIGGALPMSTYGTFITLIGTNFGPIIGRNQPVITFGTPTQQFTCFSGTVVAAHVRVECRTSAGVGGPFRWRITIGRQVSALSVGTTSYQAPVIFAVTGPPSGGLQTPGNEELEISGNSFGPVGFPAPISMTYYNGPYTYNGLSCVVKYDQILILCKSIAGVGSNFYLTVTVAGQTSAVLATTLSYLPPSITGVTSGPFKVQGGDLVAVSGTNFGNIGTLVYGRYGGGLYSYHFSTCSISVAHQSMICETAPGVGSFLYAYVTVGGQTSDRSMGYISYQSKYRCLTCMFNCVNEYTHISLLFVALCRPCDNIHITIIGTRSWWHTNHNHWVPIWNPNARCC